MFFVLPKQGVMKETYCIIRHTERGDYHGGAGGTQERQRCDVRGFFYFLDKRHSSFSPANDLMNLSNDLRSSAHRRWLRYRGLPPLPASVWYFIKVVNSRDRPHPSEFLKTPKSPLQATESVLAGSIRPFPERKELLMARVLGVLFLGKNLLQGGIIGIAPLVLLPDMRPNFL